MGEQSSAISFRTKIYVDGQLDRSLRLINKAVKIKKDGFIGEKRKKTALMFDLSKWMENDDESIENGEAQNNDSVNNFLSKRNGTKEDIKNDNDKKPDQSKFGYGAVSVYFFNAKDFDKNETATGNPIPMAALHLHYRPTQWLLARDIFAKEEPNEIFDEAQIIKEVDDTVQKTVQQVKLHSAHPGKNKDMNQEPDDDDCDISEWTGKLDLSDAQEVVEENQGAKKKSRGKKEKKNVEKVKNEMEEPADDDSDKGKSIPNDTQEVIEENQGAKKKSRGRKEKKNVEKVKNEMEESADNDCDKGKEDVQEVDEENQGTKKKSRGKKENVEKVEKSADNDCDISELAEKLTLDDAQETVEEKKKSRDKKKRNVENVPVNRYNLRPRK
ncbi:hypothetical protein C1646_173178 [Rhizophagus diaphanus]|nr:hypothetical protein C1646_173178 [Rhizophagus diaphanus] [Rhizophagus sp. MUCL 43196]